MGGGVVSKLPNYFLEIRTHDGEITGLEDSISKHKTTEASITEDVSLNKFKVVLTNVPYNEL